MGDENELSTEERISLTSLPGVLPGGFTATSVPDSFSYDDTAAWLATMRGVYACSTCGGNKAKSRTVIYQVTVTSPSYDPSAAAFTEVTARERRQCDHPEFGSAEPQFFRLIEGLLADAGSAAFPVILVRSLALDGAWAKANAERLGYKPGRRRGKFESWDDVADRMRDSRQRAYDYYIGNERYIVLSKANEL